MVRKYDTCDKFSHYVSYMTVKRCNKTATNWQSATILVTLSGKPDTQNGNKTVTKCDEFDDHVSYMTAKHVDKNGDKLVSVAM